MHDASGYNDVHYQINAVIFRIFTLKNRMPSVILHYTSNDYI